MALFQIQEPGESRVKEACPPAGYAVGIDLGTTNSLVALVQGGKPRALPADEGSTLLPSVVHYRQGGAPIVGRAARRLASASPRDTIVSVKRFMGRSADDPETRRLSPYKFSEQADQQTVVRFEVAGRQVTPVEVSAEVLRTLKARAEEQLAGPVTQAVITVPAYFDDAQRTATKEAGRLAGLEVLRLLNEPTAAALAYGLDKRSRGLFAVYDLGGGTFDVSILNLVEGVFEVKAVGGDSALGGDDFDRALAQRLLADLSLQSDPGLVRRAIDAAKAAKEALTLATSVEVELDGKKTTVTRAELEAAIKPLIERTGNASRRALRDSGAEGKLDGVILVGGSTRVPAVRAYVREIFGLEPLYDLNPDEVVALGAAVQADLLTAEKPQHDVVLLDVTPLSLGLETMGGLVEKLLPRNTTIPANATQEFTTFADGQTGMDVHVLQGERELVQDNRSLARFRLSGIPPLPSGLARIAVTFQVDADGILSVTAREGLTGVSQTITVRPTHGLTDEEVERMLLASIEHAEDDLAARMLIDARVEAQRILRAAEKQLDQNGDLLEPSERESIEESIGKLAAAVGGGDHRLIKDEIDRLDHGSAEFAKRIMNRGIEKALRGHSVDEFKGEMGAHAKEAIARAEAADVAGGGER